jgi:hypothetical protein
MPDLSIEYYWHCLTAESFSTEVTGSKGDKYIVSYDDYGHRNKSEVTFDWSCTCMGYKTKKKVGYCKHIDQVIKDNLRCGWMQFTDGGEPVEKDGEKVCPKCGGPITSQAWGV